MNSVEILRAKNNLKVDVLTTHIIQECRANQFTVADMRDLSMLLPQKIEKAIISAEEHTPFSSTL